MNKRKPTGFRCGYEEIYVGDLLSIGGGYYGFMRVVERKDGFWLEDWKKDIYKKVYNEDRKLTHDLNFEYQIVDSDDPYAEPPISIVCDQCRDVVCGKFRIPLENEEEIVWNENCGEYFIVKHKNDFDIHCRCKECVAIPNRTSKIRILEDYYQKKFSESFVKTFSHPIFTSKEEIDKWFEELESAFSKDNTDSYMKQYSDEAKDIELAKGTFKNMRKKRK